ncbi:MAG: hypothetical protein OQK70_06835, partial [Gammaproteobacteria bacterium]|nr:hypothetical protein [Gammaproteobacteria bacterium]
MAFTHKHRTRPVMQRALTRLFYTLVLLLLSGMLGLSWLGMSESGLQTAFRLANVYLPGTVSTEKLQGKLLGTVLIRKISYQVDGTLITASNIKLKWSPASVFNKNIKINQLHLQSLNIVLSQSEKTNQPIDLPEIYLSWHISLADLLIDEFSFRQNNQAIELKQISLSANSQFDRINIDKLNLKTNTLELDLKGEIETSRHYQHQLAIQWQARPLPSVVISGHGQVSGNTQALSIHQQISGPLQLTLNAEVRDLLKQLNWQADISAENINPEILWPDWPGKLSAKLSSSGQLTNGELIADVDISELKGQLRDYPVLLSSHLVWQKNGFDIDKLDFHSGTSHISASGRLTSTLNLDWMISTANLAELYPGASGEFYARGRLSGLQSAPKINARLNGKMLSIADYKISSIDSQLAVDIFNWQDIDLKLSAQSLKFKNYTLQTLDIDADSQHLKLKAVSDSVTAKVELEGNTRPQGWHGQINKIDIQTTQYANWQLDKPVAFNFDQQALLIDNLCLKSHDARLCTKVSRSNELWQSELETQNLPVTLFGPLLADNLNFEGLANATANLQFSPADQLTGQAHIQLTPGVIHYPVLEGEQERWEYHSGKINITLNNQGLNASSEIKLSNDDYLQGQLTLPGAKLTQLDINKQAIQAEVQLKIHDPGLIEVMLPEIQDIKGEVELVLSINGVMAQPGLSGHAELLNGEMRIPRLGLSIKKISLTGQSDDFEKLNFHLTGQS